MLRTTGSALLLLAALLLGGCAALLPQGSQQEQVTRLNALQNWQVRGKLSVVSPGDSVTGYLTWQQQQDQYDLFIAGPFGSGSSRLQGNRQQAELSLPGWPEPQQASSPEQLMLTYLGWNFPVSDIRYWVKGQPSPNGAVTSQYNDQGLLLQLQQHGWEIRYSRYQQRNGFWLPGLIRISGYDFRFTFAIQEWTTND